MVQIVMIIFGVIGRIVGVILLGGGLLGFIPVFFDGPLAASSAYLCGGAFLLAIAIGIVGMFMGDESGRLVPTDMN